MRVMSWEHLKGQSPTNRIDESRREAMRQLRREGWQFEDIAREFNVHRATARRHCGDIPIKSARPALTEAEVAELMGGWGRKCQA